MKLGKSLLFIFILAALVGFTGRKLTFEESQKSNTRVKTAYDRKEELFYLKCQSKSLPETFGNIFFRVFKKEGIVEVWAQKPDQNWVKFSEYQIYAQSGTIGPKRKQGDCQVPEGFYYINNFNPFSNYHLSLGLDYPNQSDLKLSTAENKGGEIYIHGGQASAGCLAMSNYFIEDIYLTAIKAKNSGQSKIPVHIFPYRMSNQNLNFFSHLPMFERHSEFWKNLQQGYQYFETHKQLPEVSVGTDGYYRFSQPGPAFASR